MTAGKTLCLNMIVKNEMANLERCLGAVAPYIHCWVIGDTGSTDGTQEFIRAFFAERNIPGELHNFPFVDFAQARNAALDHARASKLEFDYLFLTDADMELTVQNPEFRRGLTAAAYRVIQRSAVTYWNNRLLCRDTSAEYKGVTHEFLNIRAGKTENLEGIRFIDHGTGSNRVEKYERDARLLTNAIATERDPGMLARYTFYLANTLRDSGQKEAALKAYLDRARLGNWQQEVFMSLLHAAKLKEALGFADDEIIAAYLEATEAGPTRAEALHGAARFCREKAIYERGYEFAAKGLAIPYPREALFIQDWIYEYGLLDEFAINAYWAGKYAQCIEACDRLLGEGKLPADKHERVRKNKDFAVGKQREADALSEAESGTFLKLLKAARDKEGQGRPDEEVIAAFTEASAASPARAEALHGAARYCRNKRLYEQGYAFAARGLALGRPQGATYLEDWIYDYGLLDELAINAYWTGRYAECIAACDRLLSEGKLPEEKRDRVLKNKNFAIEKQPELAAPPSLESDAFLELLRVARRKEGQGRPDDEVISAYMAATAAGPTRAEALHDAARYCRNKGLHDRGYEFAVRGLAIARPSDAPGVEHWIYDYGLRQELSIVANHARDPARKDRGFAACNWLSLNRAIPEAARNLATSNLHFYLRPAAEMMPSFQARLVGFEPPEGYRPTNPSVARRGDEILLVQRAVNYTIDHTFPDGDPRRYATRDRVAFNTRNFLLRLDGDLAIQSSTEILPPEDMPEPAWPQTLGFEDMRPFVWRDGLWCVAGVRELSREGWYQQVLARIDERSPGNFHLADWRVLTADGPPRHEKNWMPRAADDVLQFVYLCDPTRLVDDQVRTIAETLPPITADQFRGGSQLIAFDNGWLALVHHARVRDKQRQYQHRFVWFEDACRLRKVSRPFFFQKRGVEFGAGLAWHPDRKRLLISYGLEDKEAWIATVDAADVWRILHDAEQLPSGVDAPRASFGATASKVISGAVPPRRGNDEEPRKDLSTDTAVVPMSWRSQIVKKSEPLVFIHSAPRTSSTWFWAKFRCLPRTLCFYESFNEAMGWLDRTLATARDVQSWDSRHSRLEPYYQEFVPLIRKSGGVRLFQPAMANEWFVPTGGLRGELRQSERKYLGLLIRHAARAGKIPVFGGWRTLGRAWVIKSAFGGFHIFQYRNLWQQWNSYLYYKNRGDFTFYNSVIDIVARSDDRYLSYLFQYYLKRSVDIADSSNGISSPQRTIGRGYTTLPRDEEKVRQLELLPEYEVFALFMASHIYLYLHAQLTADLTADVTRMARDGAYRSGIEQALRRHTGLAVSFADITDVKSPSGVEVDTSAIKWDEIRQHAQVAARILAEYGEAAQLLVSANEFIDAAFKEMQQSEGLRTDPEVEVSEVAKSAKDQFLTLAAFLRAVDSPSERRSQSRAFDARIMPFLKAGDTSALPQIHCFYEVLSDTAKHPSLIAATQSMRAAGHPVRVWSYAPQKLAFLAAHGVELSNAADVVPKGLFERIVARSEIRYFSDIFRYAALYEHGGLWMDTDVVMLRPFPFRGDYFFNLQWRDGGKGHFVCGNVIYAEPFSRHMRALYEQALERFFATPGTSFGDIGPKLLSDYIASDAGSALRDRLFSPMFFNTIDWTEVDLFKRPVAELADYLNDERVIGIHLWNARTHGNAREDDRSLIAMLSDPPARMPSFTNLADRFNTDKNRHTGNRHCYARVYDRLLGRWRFSMRRLMEIGLCRIFDGKQTETPSVALWQSYFPFCHVVGVDLTDFSQLNRDRFASFVCDQSNRNDLRAVATKLEPGSFDVIIDDGSHASADEQLTITEFWPLLADGGWYFIEDLDWQPPGEDRAKIALTKTLLGEIQKHGGVRSIDPFDVSGLRAEFAEILFFDSLYELNRARLMGGLVAIRKRGRGL